MALQEAPDSLYLDIFFPYIITSNIRFFLEEVATYAATHCVSQNPDSDLIILLNFPLPVN